MTNDDNLNKFITNLRAKQKLKKQFKIETRIFLNKMAKKYRITFKELENYHDYNPYTLAHTLLKSQWANVNTEITIINYLIDYLKTQKEFLVEELNKMAIKLEKGG